MSNNNISDKSNFADRPNIPAGQKYTAAEFNTLKNFQNAPAEQITGSLTDTNIIIDGTKQYSDTIVETTATRTITAAASGHLDGNKILQRYQFDVDCTITLANFDTTGNNTGTIAPIPAGTYDFIYKTDVNGRSLQIPSNATGVGADVHAWYQDPTGDDANNGSAQFPLETRQEAIDRAANRDIVYVMGNPAASAENITINNIAIVFAGTYGSSSFTRITGDISLDTSVAQQKFAARNLAINCFTSGFTKTSGAQNGNAEFSNVSMFYTTACNFDVVTFRGGSIERTSGADVTVNDSGDIEDFSIINSDLIYNGSTTLTLKDVILEQDLIVNSGTVILEGSTVIKGVISGAGAVTENRSLSKIDVGDQSIESVVEFKRLVHANNDSNATKTFTATPTFAFAVDGQAQQMTLTGNVTTFSTSGEVGSSNMDVYLINDGTAGRTVAAPTGWTADPSSETHTEAANAINRYQFYTLPDGTKFFNLHIVKA